MKLSRAQRLALFAGETPRITFPGGQACPIPTGHVEELSANVRLEVTGIRRTKKGEWSLIYTLHNNRLGQRFLARQQGQAHPQQYVSNSAGGIDHQAGEAVDDFTQKRLTREARQREKEGAMEVVIAAESVLAALREREADYPEFRAKAGRSIRRIRAELDRLLREQRRKAA